MGEAEKRGGISMRTGWRLLLGTLVCALFCAGCGGGADGSLPAQSIPKEGVVAVNVVSENGDVQISRTRGDEVKVKAKYRVDAQNAERRRLIEKNLVIENSVDENGLLTLYSHLGSGATIGVAGEEEDYRIDLEVQVPDGMGSVVVQSQEGDISLDGLRGVELLLVGNTGSITVRDVSIAGTSSVTAMLGDIDMRLKSIEDAERLTVSADLGDLRLNVPKNASYTVTIQELSQPATTWKNRGGETQLSLSAKVGSVRFQK